MALTSTNKSICNKLVSDYSSIVAPVKNAKSVIRSKKNEVDSTIRSMNFSDDGAINSAIDQFQNSVNAAIPGDDISSMNDLKAFLDDCSYLTDFSPVSAILGTFTGVYDNIDNLINSLGANVPEFGAAALISTINNLLNGLGIPGGGMLAALLAQADKLLNCLDSICATADPSYVENVSNISSDLNNLYGDLNIIDDPFSPNYGKFDVDSAFDDAGLILTQKEKINRVVTSIDSTKLASKIKIEDSIKKVKSLTKLGGFF